MRTAGALALAALFLIPSPGSAISRFEVLVRARTYAEHPWHCGPSNLTASCSAAYQSVYSVGDYVGLPYDWGGYVTLHEFDLGIDGGSGAGSYSDDGVLACTVGLDCSGYVSRAWDTGHYSTSSMHNVSSEIDPSDVKPADAFNIPGYHVKLFETTQANGDPRFLEAAGYNVHVTFWDSWTSVNGYTPIRYQSIEDTPSSYPDGTADNPVVVTSFPFVDERDTSLSLSDQFDVCLGAAPAKGEYGPEMVYRLDLVQPGTVTVAVQDDGDTDVDVHLYRALNEWDCFARNDKVVEAPVDCGPLFVVADSYTTASTGTDHPGPYTLTIDFEAVDQPCGQGPPPYDPGGHAGGPCGYPSEPSLPFCNPNLGGVFCLYTSGVGATSFCTYPCKGSGDCLDDFPGGCCEFVDTDIGDACMPAAFCAPDQPDPGTPVPDEGTAENTGEIAAPDQGNPWPDTVGDTGTQWPDETGGTVYDTGTVPPPDTPSFDPGPTGGSNGCTATGGAGSPVALLLLLLALVGMAAVRRVTQF